MHSTRITIQRLTISLGTVQIDLKLQNKKQNLPIKARNSLKNWAKIIFNVVLEKNLKKHATNRSQEYQW